MRRTLLLIFAAIAFVVAALPTVLWVRSYYASDSLFFTESNRSTRLHTVAGDLIWTRAEMPLEARGWSFDSGSPARPEQEIVNKRDLLRRHTLFYRYADVRPSNSAFHVSTMAVPFWWWNTPLILMALTICVASVRWAFFGPSKLPSPDDASTNFVLKRPFPCLPSANSPADTNP